MAAVGEEAGVTGDDPITACSSRIVGTDGGLDTVPAWKATWAG